MKLHHLSLFLKIVEKGGLAAAGRELGLSPTTVSERLAALEKHYGVTLINRTTRAIRLTEEGKALLDGARHVIDGVNELDSRIRFGAQTLSGLIRVSAPIDIGRTTIVPVVDAFLLEHPKTRIELLLTDGYLNIVDGGIDIAVRFGEPADSTLRVRRLAPNRRVVCASRTYLQAHGHPTSPADLQQHNCLLMRFGQQLDNVWHFDDAGTTQRVAVSGNRIANDGSVVHDWCLAGHGIMLKSIWDVRKELASGDLVAVLESFAPAPTYVQMLFPPSRNQPRRVRALGDRLVATFAGSGAPI